MSKTEDYLDSLLNNVSPERKAEEERKGRRGIASDFSAEFEKELNDADMEDFIRDFEIELDSDNDIDFSENSEDSFFDSLEGIVKNAKEASEENGEQEEASGIDFEINTLEDDAWTEEQSEPKAAVEEPSGESEESKGEPEESKGESERSAEEQELLDMLAELPSDDELSNIGELLRSDDDNITEASQVSEEKEETEHSVTLQEEEADSMNKKEKKGFFKKLLSVFFGDEEEDELSDVENAAVSEEAAQEEEEFGNMSEENRQILSELNAAGKSKSKSDSGEKEEKKKKEKKKKEKKEKKPKEKKEKKPKEKKPKKPKEVDLSPPLPRKPVILIFIMGISIILLIMLVSNLTGYSLNISGAKEAFAAQDYVKAYHNLAGLKVKEQDTEFYERVTMLAKVQAELENGTALYEAKQYKMALDSYVCALGRYDANYNDAVTWGIQEEYDVLAGQITAQLAEKFGVSAETAREIYGIRDRREYTNRIYEIVDALGLTE